MKSKVYAEGFAALLAALSLASCSIVGTKPGSAASTQPVVQHLGVSGDYTYSVDLGPTPRDLYFVFTNTDLKSSATKPSVGNIVINGAVLPGPEPQQFKAFDPLPTSFRERIAEFNRNPAIPTSSSTITTAPQANISTRDAAIDAKGQTDIFFLDFDQNTGAGIAPVNATCALVNSNVNLGDGRIRSLSIWVDSSKYLSSITDPMVAALADRFLQNPASANDIYHWDTSVVGEPWGPHSVPQMLAWDSGNTITVLLSDLNVIYTGSVTVGYFYPKDNYKASVLPGSNQRIMFYLDSTLYSTLASGESSWASTNYWPKILFSTLAHEFQHMIQFYQKQVLFNNPTGADTWINEMCSQIMEDLVADKLGVEGPRGVMPPSDPSPGVPGNTQGRIPSFNSYLSLGLSGYNLNPAKYVLEDYSTSYSFGAWLARNYGGASLLRKIVQDPATDPDCVINAVSAITGRTETLPKLLDRWAISVLASDRMAMPPGYKYNNGNTWFVSSSGGVDFNLGSINFFYYSPAPRVITTSGNLPSGQQFYSASNIYFRATPSTGASGTQSYTVSVPEGVAFSTYVTP